MLFELRSKFPPSCGVVSPDKSVSIPVKLLPSPNNLPNEPVEVAEPLMFPVAVISDVAPAVKLPTCKEPLVCIPPPLPSVSILNLSFSVVENLTSNAPPPPKYIPPPSPPLPVAVKAAVPAVPLALTKSNASPLNVS